MRPDARNAARLLGAGALAGLFAVNVHCSGKAPERIASPTTPRRAFAPPTVAELAALFPQLEHSRAHREGRDGGTVYKARQKELDRIVALKIFAIGDERRGRVCGRFTREAKALAKLNHPGIVTIHEFARAGPDGLFYFPGGVCGRTESAPVARQGKGLGTRGAGDRSGDLRCAAICA